MSYGGSPFPGTRVQALAGADFCTIIKGSQLEVLRENSQVLQPTAGDQLQTQVNEGGKLLHRTPRTSNRARGGQLTPGSLLFRYVGEITSGWICWSDRLVSNLPVRSDPWFRSCLVGYAVQIIVIILGQICVRSVCLRSH